MERIKNIIFDFGGVILDIDFKKMEEAFKALGIKDPKALYSKAQQSQLFVSLEKGEISNEVFRDEFRTISGLDISDKELDAAWNSLLEGFPRFRLTLLNQLKEHYRIFLLSNSNKIHYPVYAKWLVDESGLTFEQIFEKTYFSFDHGIIKPDKAIYEKILRENDLRPEETLYIDDTAENLPPAAELGMYVYHLEEGEDLVELFDEHYHLYED